MGYAGVTQDESVAEKAGSEPGRKHKGAGM